MWQRWYHGVKFLNRNSIIDERERELRVYRISSSKVSLPYAYLNTALRFCVMEAVARAPASSRLFSLELYSTTDAFPPLLLNKHLLIRHFPDGKVELGKAHTKRMVNVLSSLYTATNFN